MTGSERTDYERVASILKRARKVFVITGAGISAESGIPTFRGKDGLWRNYNALELATPDAFERDPALVWEWYLWRRGIVGEAEPNEGHRILARWEERFPEFLIATQNVDRLHHRAGSTRVVEVHGNIIESRCTRTGRVFGPDEAPISPVDLPPKSPDGGLLRPNVVWFGERMPEEPLRRIDEFLGSGPPDVSFIIGTTGVLMYIQMLAGIAAQSGRELVEINPEATALSGVSTAAFRASATEALGTLDKMIND